MNTGYIEETKRNNLTSVGMALDYVKRIWSL